MTIRPLLVYFTAQSYESSGVLTLGERLRCTSGARLLHVMLESNGNLLNENNLIQVPFELSHEFGLIQSMIMTAIADSSIDVVFMPNNSLHAYELCHRLAGKLNQVGINVKIFGIVHSNTEASINLPISYINFVSAIVGVSAHITKQLCLRLTNKELPCKTLNYPIGKIEYDINVPVRPDTLLRIVYVGRLNAHQKNFGKVIALIGLLDTLDVPYTLDIYGQGHMSDELMSFMDSRRLNQLDNVRWHGQVEHSALRRALALYDVLILVSEFEGYPLAIMEAMASGVVPVIFNYGDEVHEVVIHGESGLVIHQNDLDQMAHSIAELAYKREKLFPLRRGALHHSAGFRNEQSWLRNIDELHNETKSYASLISTRFPIVEDTPWIKLNSELNRISLRLHGEEKIIIWGGGYIGRMLIDKLHSSGVFDPQKAVIFDRTLYALIPSYRDVRYVRPDIKILNSASSVVIASLYYSSEILITLEGWLAENNMRIDILTLNQ